MKKQKPNERPRVVIVNPRIDWQNTLRRLFTNAGYDVVGSVPDGATAIRIMSHANPDLMIIDDDLLAGEHALSVAADVRNANTTVVIIILGDGHLLFEGRGIDKGKLGSGEGLLELAAQALAN